MIAPPGSNAFDLVNLDFDPAAPIGSLYVKGAAGTWTFLIPGASGTFLKSLGTGATPVYAAVPGGGDMLASTYDPTGLLTSAFDFSNFLIAAQARGDLITRGAAAWGRLGTGVSGQVLTSQGPGADLIWAAASGDMLQTTYDPLGVAGDAFDFNNFGISGEAPGDLIIRGASDFDRLPIGTAGQVPVVPLAGGSLGYEAPPHPTDYINECNLSFTSVTEVDIGVGEARSDDDLVNIVVGSPITVDITVSGENGLDTGSEASSTWYEVYLIWKESPLTVSGLLVAQGGTPVLPAGFTKKRRVGAVRNNSGSDIIDFTQQGKGQERTYFWLSAESTRNVLSGGAATTPTVVDLSTLMPDTSTVAFINATQNSIGRTLELYQTTGGQILMTLLPEQSRSLAFPTDSSQQIAYSNAGGGAAGDVDIDVRGFIEAV